MVVPEKTIPITTSTCQDGDLILVHRLSTIRVIVSPDTSRSVGECNG